MKEREQVENSFHCLANANAEKPENVGSYDNFYGLSKDRCPQLIDLIPIDCLVQSKSSV